MGSGLGCTGELTGKTQVRGGNKGGGAVGNIRNNQEKPLEDSLLPLSPTFVALGATDGIILRMDILSLGTQIIPLLPVTKRRDQSSDP